MSSNQNSIDMRDMLLEAVADVREQVRSVILELAEPALRQQVVMQWAQMPQEIKDKLATERPEEYKSLMDYLGG